MTTLSNPTSRRRAAICAATFILFALCAVCASAQAPPYALFQDSTLTSTTNTINVTQLPVVTTTGTSYVNVVIEFDVSSDGTLSVAPGYPQITPAATPLVLGFEAGNYFGGGAQSSYGIDVSGPGVGQGGNTEWSLAVSSNGNYTFPSNAVWFVVGNIKNSPLYSRIEKAKIDTQGWDAFGTVGSDECLSGECGTYWTDKTLIGLAQIGNQLSISSFTTTNGTTQTDSSTAVDSITYCLNSPCGTGQQGNARQR
ncbi:MAG: hypothetical protein ABR874_01460 [Candidatus Sulfotelmatobacter sp.]|jgi:hypothetical protein